MKNRLKSKGIIFIAMKFIKKILCYSKRPNGSKTEEIP